MNGLVLDRNKKNTYGRLSNRMLIIILSLFVQEIDCSSIKRSSRSLLECTDQSYFKYDVTHDSQLWSLAANSGSVRQELEYKYTCDKAHPPLRFIGWDETDLDNLDETMPCDVR